MSEPVYEILSDQKLAIWFSVSQWGMFCWATLPFCTLRPIHAENARQVHGFYMARRRKRRVNVAPPPTNKGD